jgi:hypothetical protein
VALQLCGGFYVALCSFQLMDFPFHGCFVWQVLFCGAFLACDGFILAWNFVFLLQCLDIGRWICWLAAVLEPCLLCSVTLFF